MTPNPTTIIPIFAVVFIGWLERRKGFIKLFSMTHPHAAGWLISRDFLEPANRLAYYIGTPAIAFGAWLTMLG